MGTPDVARILAGVPGRLCVGPMNLATAFPHGGTALGLVRELAVRVLTARAEVVAEEFGAEAVEQVYLGQRWALVGTMRSLDDDMVQRLFPATATGTTTQHRVISYPGTARAGDLRSASSVVLCFSPDDLDRHPMVLFHRALPLVEEQAELQARLDQEAGFAFAFLAIRATDGRAVSLGQREDLTL